MRELGAQDKDLKNRGGANRNELEAAEIELTEFDSQEGQQMSRVESVSRDTAKAWKWVQDHQDDFEREVYGPPMISCSIKDARYTDAIESIFSRNDFLAITAQTKNDWSKLSDAFYGTLKLGDVTIRTATDSLSDYPSPRVGASDMQRFGFDGWALEFVDGPEPVLSMLCDKVRLHSTGIGLREISEDQHNMIVQGGVVNSWVVGRNNYRVSRRAEYGPGASSTSTKIITPARYWTDRPVDGSRRQEIEVKIQTLNGDFNTLKEQIQPIREKLKNLKDEFKNVIEELVSQPLLLLLSSINGAAGVG
jgi:hypothetical protein